MIRIFIRKLLDRLPYISRLRKLLGEAREYPPGHYYSPVPSCPRCGGPMTFQGVQSIGAGAARIYNVKVYLCSFVYWASLCTGATDQRMPKRAEVVKVRL